MEDNKENLHFDIYVTGVKGSFILDLINLPFGFFLQTETHCFCQDFGDTIPGHGGLVDRFDCQFLMATFVYVYHSTFIR